MTCHEFLTAIDAYLDDELSVMAALRMHGHALSCDPCRTMMASEAILHDLLSDVAANDEPPDSLGDRIIQHVISEETNAPGRRSQFRSLGGMRSWLTGAAMLGLALVLALIPASRRRSDLVPLAVEVAAKHLLYSAGSPSTLDQPAAAPSELARRLESQAGFSVRLPRLGADEHLLGGRVSSVADAPAAYLLYERRGRRISLFVMRTGSAEPHAGFERVVQGVELYASALGHIRLLWWEDEDDGRLYAAAASGADSDLMEFALLCIQCTRPRGAPRTGKDAPGQGSDCAASADAAVKENDLCVKACIAA
jgi:anti-sigma factor RsiW